MWQEVTSEAAEESGLFRWLSTPEWWYSLLNAQRRHQPGSWSTKILTQTTCACCLPHICIYIIMYQKKIAFTFRPPTRVSIQFHLTCTNFHTDLQQNTAQKAVPISELMDITGWKTVEIGTAESWVTTDVISTRSFGSPKFYYCSAQVPLLQCLRYLNDNLSMDPLCPGSRISSFPSYLRICFQNFTVLLKEQIAWFIARQILDIPMVLSQHKI
jgi:hypothetical protein